jgi:tetratricopeptide (TPR) repeat protein
MNNPNKTEGNTQPQLTIDEMYSVAVDHANSDRYKEAEELCTAIVQQVPNHITAINLLGTIGHKLNRHEFAAKWFQRGINIDSKNAESYYNLGISLNELGRSEEAIHVLEIALRKEPNNGHFASYLNGILKLPTIFDKEKILKEEAQDTGEADLLPDDEAETKIWYRTDQHGTIKASLIVWFVLLYSMRNILILGASSFRTKLPMLKEWVYQYPEFLIISIIPLLIFIVELSRLPQAKNIYTAILPKVWVYGRLLLLFNVSLDIAFIVNVYYQNNFDLDMFLTVFFFIDLIILIYLISSKYIKALFNSFPDFVEKSVANT